MKHASLKEGLSEARNYCPGLTEDVYRFAEYVASKMPSSEPAPLGLVLEFYYACSDVKAGIRRFGAEKLPQYLNEHRFGILKKAPDILLVVDKIADPSYSAAVRSISKDMLNWEASEDKAYNKSAVVNKDYPPYVKTAVDWWVSAIINQESAVHFSNVLLHDPGQLSSDRLDTFRSILSDRIMSEMRKYETVSLHVDYQPDELLREAWEASGANTRFALLIFPTKTSMFICKDVVKLRDGGVMKTIWEAD